MAAFTMALVARRMIDPLWGENAPLFTFHCAVAFTIWFSGWRIATAVAISGWTVGLYWFSEPTPSLGAIASYGTFRSISFFTTCTAYIILGESMRRARQRHAASEEKVTSILDNMGECFCSVDRGWRFTYINRSGESYLGFTQTSTEGRPFFEVLPHLAGTLVETELRRAMERRTPVRFEAEGIIARGWADVVATPTPEGLSIFFHDITAKKTHVQQLEQEVAERTTELRETIVELEAFSYTLVHDMRAPLRAMRNFATLLISDTNGKLTPTEAGHLQRIERAAHRMDRLIQDVLTYSQLGRKKPAPEAVDLHALVQELLESYPNFHPGKAEIEIEGQLPIVLGNYALLTQCFSNLLHNATKFVAPGTRPHVRVYAEEHGSHVRVFVQDNGIGISPAARSRIFEPFHREDPRYEGTGIGLAIVRKVIGRLDGQIGLESEIGRGSRFWVELKLAPAGAAAIAVPQAVEPAKVLV